MAGLECISLRRTLVFVICFYFSLIFDFTSGIYTFDVFRMIQYDKAGATFGTQRSNVALQAVSLSSDIARKMVVVHYEHLNLTLIEEINAKAGGLLVVLPSRDVQLSREAIDRWIELEAQLCTTELRIPVYFSVMSPEIEQLMSEITHEDAQEPLGGFLSSIYSDEYFMVASTSEPAPIKGVTLHNFQVLLLPSIQQHTHTLPFHPHTQSCTLM